MKISNKISFLVLFLIAALGLNAFIAMRQVSRISDQLREVTQKDLVLTDVCNTVTRNYLENAVRFQAMLNIGDELGSEQMPPSRRQYLLSHIVQLKAGFDRVTQTVGSVIIKGKDLITNKTLAAAQDHEKKELELVGELLHKIESAYVEYDGLFQEIYTMIGTGTYQLSLEDLARTHKKERILSDKITSLLAETRLSTQKTLEKASREEDVARHTLFLGLMGIILISIITSILIIRSFSGPLKKLVIAANDIGKGKFNVQLDTHRHDEIGEVGAAFKTMTAQIQAFQNQLEEKNKALEQNLELTQKQKEDLERINRELDRFAHTVSHDIAQPLTGIVAYSAILEENYAAKLDERAQRSIKGIHHSSKRLGAMINDLLALSRLSRLKNPYEKIDIAQVIEEAKSRLEYSINQSKARIEVAEMPTIWCDRIKMTEIFFNLLSNAIKFSMKNKEYMPKIWIGYVEMKDFHQFHVRDNGMGIPTESQTEIFEIFKRLESAADLEGTGAGLSIVKTAVEDQGGKIWVESVPGDGATFYFTIAKNLVKRV